MLDIVTHCYCPPGVEHYATCLRVQAASLKWWPPSCRVRLFICTTPSDVATAREINNLLDLQRDLPDNVTLFEISLPPGELFRRAIGRNLASKRTLADAVWYTDVDYWFGEGCLQAVVDQVHAGSLLSMPSQVRICRDHETGDALIAEASQGVWPRLSPEFFEFRVQRPCIGGVQIIGGDYARQHGYLEGTKWIEPVDPSAGFRSCKCDRAYRQGMSAKRLAIPNVFRLRHTRDGRDYDQTGNRIGRKVW